MTRNGTPDDGGDGNFARLDPAADPVAWERRVGAITAAAEPELSRRSGQLAPAFGLQLEQWARPVLTAAASLIVAGTALLTLSGGPRPAGGGPLAAARGSATVSSPAGSDATRPISAGPSSSSGSRRERSTPRTRSVARFRTMASSQARKLFGSRQSSSRSSARTKASWQTSSASCGSPVRERATR